MSATAWLVAGALVLGPDAGPSPSPIASPTDPAPGAEPAPDAEPAPEPAPDAEGAPAGEAGPEEPAAPAAQSDDAAAPTDEGDDAEAEPVASGVHAPVPPPSAYDPGAGVAPGGYWGPGEGRERAPPGGQEQLLAAYIVLPLSTLTTISGAVSMYFLAPGHCPQRLGGSSSGLDTKSCQGLFIFSAIRTGYGAAGIVAGLALLAVGLHRRNVLKEWKRRHFQGMSAWGGRAGAGLTATLRF